MNEGKTISVKKRELKGKMPGDVRRLLAANLSKYGNGADYSTRVGYSYHALMEAYKNQSATPSMIAAIRAASKRKTKNAA